MKKVPMRKCIACMESKPKKELLRIVKIGNNEIKFDATGKLDGRGLYVCGIECLNRAIKTKRIDNMLKIKVSNDDISKLVQDINTFAKQ